jgi:asparagine synthase (glutamine-hydrolysing)
MCGIAGIVQLDGQAIPRLAQKLDLMNQLIAHRGPDDHASWLDPSGCAGHTHRRLSIIDLSPAGRQPMVGNDGRVLTFNGEIYNYLELREPLRSQWSFRSDSDSEVILASHARHGDDAVHGLRGMWAYTLWDPKTRRLTASRDRFGIKPFYYAVAGRTLYYASEIKALLPFLDEVRTHGQALAEYVTFQFTLGPETLFEGVRQLPAAHILVAQNGQVREQRYWDVQYEPDEGHAPEWYEERVRELVEDSLTLHLRSDVPVGAYVSGGVDSSLVALLSSQRSAANRTFFHGKFTEFPGYDESRYAEEVAKLAGGTLYQVDITGQDFADNIGKIIWHLDQPVAGPGAFPQYMVSKLAAEHVKVVLGGQGGDEIFGGYARVMVGYLEQCLKAGVEGTLDSGLLQPSFQDILPRLDLLKDYKPLIQTLFSQGMFGPLDSRYFRLINRAADMKDELDWGQVSQEGVFERFAQEFNRPNTKPTAYLDRMTHFDFKFLLPALLQVEDRMSMAHGLEARVPLLDHPLVEFAATIPPRIKFAGGNLKHMLKHSFRDVIPADINNRRDKMGFPTPLNEWLSGELKDFVGDTFSAPRARQREFLNPDVVLASVSSARGFSRKAWGLLSLELWHQQFHDTAAASRKKAMAVGAL